MSPSKTRSILALLCAVATPLTACSSGDDEPFVSGDPSAGEARAISEASEMLENPRPGGDEGPNAAGLPQSVGDNSTETAQ